MAGTQKQAFPLLNGPFSDLNGPFPRVPQWAVFPLENPLENGPLRKGALRGSWHPKEFEDAKSWKAPMKKDKLSDINSGNESCQKNPPPVKIKLALPSTPPIPKYPKTRNFMDMEGLLQAEPKNQNWRSQSGLANITRNCMKMPFLPEDFEDAKPSKVPMKNNKLSEIYFRNDICVMHTCFGPDVMQSGFGVNFLFWSSEL